mgnify:CR=1 FL=1
MSEYIERINISKALGIKYTENNFEEKDKPENLKIKSLIITSSAWLGPIRETIGYLSSSGISSLNKVERVVSFSVSKPFAVLINIVFFVKSGTKLPKTSLNAALGIDKIMTSLSLTASAKEEVALMRGSKAISFPK